MEAEEGKTRGEENGGVDSPRRIVQLGNEAMPNIVHYCRSAKSKYELEFDGPQSF